MKKLPKSVVLAGRKWDVVLSVCCEDDAGCYGETRADTSTIILYTAIHERYKADLRATLFHEMCHAALASTGVNAVLKGGAEEAVVRALEAALWPALKAI